MSLLAGFGALAVGFWGIMERNFQKAVPALIVGILLLLTPQFFKFFANFAQ